MADHAGQIRFVHERQDQHAEGGVALPRISEDPRAFNVVDLIGDSRLARTVNRGRISFPRDETLNRFLDLFALLAS